MAPEKMNLPAGIYQAAKKLRSSRERGEFLMAALALFFEGEEVEVSERPDLLLDGWRDRIRIMRGASESGSAGGRAKAGASDAQGSAKGRRGDGEGSAKGEPRVGQGSAKGEPRVGQGSAKGAAGDPSPTLGGDMRIEIGDTDPKGSEDTCAAGAAPAPPAGRGKAKARGKARPARRAFARPSVEEVRAYVESKGYTFSPEAFVGYYESNGWRVGRNPMTSWKGACATWQDKQPGGFAALAQAPATVPSPEEVDAEWEALYAEQAAWDGEGGDAGADDRRG